MVCAISYNNRATERRALGKRDCLCTKGTSSLPKKFATFRERCHDIPNIDKLFMFLRPHKTVFSRKYNYRSVYLRKARYVLVVLGNFPTCLFHGSVKE